MTARLISRWVDLYTRGLSEAAQRDRRAELVSDIWEHQATLGDGVLSGLSLLSRWLRGIPADLSWRRAQRHGRRLPASAAVVRGMAWSVAGLSYALFVVTHGWGATALLGLNLYGGDTWDPSGLSVYAWLCASLWSLLVIGGVLLATHPRLGASLAAAGALGTPLAFPWGAAMYGPAALAITCGAVVFARRRRRVLRLRASSARC